jgi:hypothetical protein
MDTQETPATPAPDLPMKTLQQVQKEHIIAVIAVAPTLDEAARILDIDIATLYRKRVRMNLGVVPRPAADPLAEEPKPKPKPEREFSKYEPFKAARELLKK